MRPYLLAILICLSSLLAAQEPVAKESKAEEESRFPEVEFVASDVFRSGSYVQPLWKGLHFEGHYFGGDEADVGFTGASWKFRWKGLGLIPGFGVAFGSNQFTTGPAFSFRWEYEKKWFVTQGLVIQSFRSTPILEEEHTGEGTHESEPVTRFVRPTISDGNHASARWKRITIGPTWEHIQFREGDEWKYGGRLAVRLATHVSAVLYVLTPGRTEFRGGVIVHPAQAKD